MSHERILRSFRDSDLIRFPAELDVLLYRSSSSCLPPFISFTISAANHVDSSWEVYGFIDIDQLDGAILLIVDQRAPIMPHASPRSTANVVCQCYCNIPTHVGMSNNYADV